jgi:hypothetical protein
LKYFSSWFSPGNFNFRCNYCGLSLRDGSRDYHLKKVGRPSLRPFHELSTSLSVQRRITLPLQMHQDILAVIRPGLVKSLNKKPSNASVNTPADASDSLAPITQESSAANPASSSKDEDGLMVRRATRARAKVRVEAMCDVVALSDVMVRTALGKLSLPPELSDLIR